MDLPAHQMQRFVTREDNMVEAELVFYETESDEDSVELELDVNLEQQFSNFQEIFLLVHR